MNVRFCGPFSVVAVRPKLLKLLALMLALLYSNDTTKKLRNHAGNRPQVPLFAIQNQAHFPSALRTQFRHPPAAKII
jgi:hypothetical protein